MNNQFRVWDGEAMHEGDTAFFCVRPDGNVYQMLFDYPIDTMDPLWQFMRRPDCEALWATGAFDRNGKPIFQGDIVQGGRSLDCLKDKRSVVIWRERGFWIEDESFGWEGEDLWDWDDLVVVGNKYQHPHLLNKENPHPAETE